MYIVEGLDEQIWVNEGGMMATAEKKLFKHGGSWAVDLPMSFAKEVNNMSVIIETSPTGILIKPKTELDTMEAHPLFQQFVKAIAVDAMNNPNALHAAQDVWDDEWINLLKGVEFEEKK